MNYFAVIITCILFDFLARVILFVTGLSHMYVFQKDFIELNQFF